jgi:hypothetical protein
MGIKYLLRRWEARYIPLSAHHNRKERKQFSCESQRARAPEKFVTDADDAGPAHLMARKHGAELVKAPRTRRR